jgi:hypothetical protein
MKPPIPAALSLLVLALPGVFATGLSAARRVTGDRALALALAPALALAAWLSAVHAVGLATRSFVVGLLLGTLATAVAAPLLPGRPVETAPRPADPRAWRRRLLLIVAVALPVAWMAFGWDFHDEDLLTGHLSIPAAIQNDVYPPRHLSFAAVELGYHHGFDLLTACIATLFRLRIGRAIDIATVGLWALSAWLLLALGERLLSRERAWLAVAATLFGGGLPCCLEASEHGIRDALGFCTIAGGAIASPLASNFFQHPWGLGVPLALATWLVFLDGRRGPARLALLSLLLVALSFAQVVLFGALLASLGAAELLALRRERRPAKEWLALLACGALVVVGARKKPPWQSGLPFTLRAGVAPGSVVRWHLQSFGALLPVGAVGLCLLPPRARAPLGLFAALCLLALNFTAYRYSGDSVKFGGAAGVALGLGAAVVVDRIARHGARLVAALALVAVTAGGLAFALPFVALPSRVSTVLHAIDLAASPDDEPAAAFLRARARPGEIVYRRWGPSRVFALGAGLPTVWLDWGVSCFGYPATWIDARLELLRLLPASPEPWARQGITWFVLDDSDRDLRAHAAAWIAGGAAVEAARFGALQVIRLQPSPTGPR